MPDISELKKSSFLTKGDLGPRGEALFTITGCEQVNVAKEGAPADMKWALMLEENDKPFILNSTNGQIMAAFMGSTKTEHWTGKRTVLYWDPNVSYAGKLTGGIRARAPRGAAAGQPVPASRSVPAPAPEPEVGEDVPF